MGQTCFYVGIPVDESHELLEAPEAALAETDNALGEVIVVPTFGFLLDVLDYSSNHPLTHIKILSLVRAPLESLPNCPQFLLIISGM